MARNIILSRATPNQQLDLPHTSGQEQIPSPKRNAIRTKERRHLPWETNYAAFSLDFAIASLRKLSPSARNVIFDPFAGSGTTIEAAVASGLKSYGVELNPYSALLSRCRIANRADFHVVADLLKRASKNVGKSTSVGNDILNLASLTPINALKRLLSQRLNCTQENLVASLCIDPSGQFDTEVVALISALHAARKNAQVHHRSNPAWLMLGSSPDGEVQSTQSWRDVALDVAETIIVDIENRQNKKRPAVTIYPGSFQNSPIKRRSISRFLTSPPYLNRLDYVNPTMPELFGLGMQDKENIESLRYQMMGTTKMRPFALTGRKIPSQAATALLNDIADHASKASATYYYRFYQQYLSDLFDFLVWLEGHTTTSCEGIVVIQDSFYKEIKVPIATIISELAEYLGFTVSILFEESRSKHMGSISPHQRAHAPSKILTEYTLLLRRKVRD